jgi:cysteine desulfurase
MPKPKQKAKIKPKTTPKRKPPKKPVYLDNNATMQPNTKAIQLMSKLASKITSQNSSHVLNDSLNYVRNHCHLPTADVIFTSGASESNSTIIRSVIESWWRLSGTKPHIITTAVEHNSILFTLQFIDPSRVEYTLIQPDITGMISVDHVINAVKDNTALITVMGANNELGTIYPVQTIAERAYELGIPVHSDMTQVFGKYKLNMKKLKLSAISMSFHKLCGPTGVGMLILDHKFKKGYDLRGLINGKQQMEFRAGTENIPGIAASILAMKMNFDQRTRKNAELSKLRTYAKSKLIHLFTEMKYGSIVNEAKGNLEKAPDNITGTKRIGICFLGSHQKCHVLPSTLLISLICVDKKLCNMKLRDCLKRRRITVGIGSACNINSKKASHVLEAIRAPSIVKRGVMRISFSCENTKDDVNRLCDELQDLFANHLRSITK